MIVADASVLVDLLLGRPATTAALADATADRNEWLHAPDLVEPEMLNALRKLVARKAITDRRASEAVDDLGRLPVRRYPHFPLRPRVWQLRRSLTAYDATYLALAEVLGGSLLLTADRGLATRAERVIGRGRAVLVA